MDKVFNKGQKPKTWDDVKSFDDCVVEREKELLSELIEDANKKGISICSELGKQDNFFYFCKKSYVPRAGDETPSPMSEIYKRHVESAAMQLFCFGGCKRCCFYNGQLKR